MVNGIFFPLYVSNWLLLTLGKGTDFCILLLFSCPFVSHSLQPPGSMPGFPVLHYLPEFAQTHVHWVGDAIQPSHPPALNHSQPQGLFQWVGHLQQATKLLELQFQHQSFQLVFRVDFFQDWLVWSPCYPRDSQRSLLQYHSSKASILWHSVLFRRRQWQPTPVLLPGKSHGRRSLVGCNPWGPEESGHNWATSLPLFYFHALEKEMATQSSILAWRIPGTGAWRAAIYGVAQSRTRLMWLSSSSSCPLCCPALITVPDHGEDHSLDYTDLCLQSDASAFQHTVIVFLPSSNSLLISWMHDFLYLPNIAFISHF